MPTVVSELLCAIGMEGSADISISAGDEQREVLPREAASFWRRGVKLQVSNNSCVENGDHVGIHIPEVESGSRTINPQ